jgi:hypothetical protein
MFNSLLKEEDTSPTLHQISSVEVEQHIMLDHCYEESFKLRLIDNLSSTFDQITANQDSRLQISSPTKSDLNVEENNFYENVIEKTPTSHNIDLNETIDPSCSSFGAETSNDSKIDEFYSQTPKTNNKENSKLLKKVRGTNNSNNNNKYYETRQKDRKMRSGHVLSNTMSETTKKRSVRMPIIIENNQDNIKRLQKKIIGKVFQNTSEENCRILRKSFYLKESGKISCSSSPESPLAYKNSKYLKLNNIFLSKKRQKLYWNKAAKKSTKRLNSEKFTKKNSKT